MREDLLWSLGARNESANEFSDSAAQDVFEQASVPWFQFRKSLTVDNPSVSIRCDIWAADLEIPRVLQMKVLGTDGFMSGDVDISVNGTKVRPRVGCCGRGIAFLPQEERDAACDRRSPRPIR